MLALTNSTKNVLAWTPEARLRKADYGMIFKLDIPSLKIKQNPFNKNTAKCCTAWIPE